MVISACSGFFLWKYQVLSHFLFIFAPFLASFLLPTYFFSSIFLLLLFLSFFSFIVDLLLLLLLMLLLFLTQNSMTKYSPVEAKLPPKSGMRRLFSYDSRFFIRCIPTESVAEMHRFLKEYHQVIDCCSCCLYFCNVRIWWTNWTLQQMVCIRVD